MSTLGNITNVSGYLGGSASNLLTSGTLSASGSYGWTPSNWYIKISITHLTVMNTDTTSEHYFSLYVGTNFKYYNYYIAPADDDMTPSNPNFVEGWWNDWTLMPSQYLVGVADTSSVLVYNIEFYMEMIQKA